MYYRFILSFGHSDTMYDSNKKHVRVVLIGRDTLSEDTEFRFQLSSDAEYLPHWDLTWFSNRIDLSHAQLHDFHFSSIFLFWQQMVGMVEDKTSDSFSRGGATWVVSTPNTLDLRQNPISASLFKTWHSVYQPY